MTQIFAAIRELFAYSVTSGTSVGFGVSVITNCGLSDEAGDHEDVQRQGRKAGVKMQTLFLRMIENLE